MSRRQSKYYLPFAAFLTWFLIRNATKISAYGYVCVFCACLLFAIIVSRKTADPSDKAGWLKRFGRPRFYEGLLVFGLLIVPAFALWSDYEGRHLPLFQQGLEAASSSSQLCRSLGANVHVMWPVRTSVSSIGGTEEAELDIHLHGDLASAVIHVQGTRHSNTWDAMRISAEIPPDSVLELQTKRP